jgi:hypothetical protein
MDPKLRDTLHRELDTILNRDGGPDNDAHLVLILKVDVDDFISVKHIATIHPVLPIRRTVTKSVKTLR